MKLRIGDDRACLFVGDSADAHTLFPPGSVDSLVTDPPAGIGFMGREWDSDRGGRVQWIEWLAGVLRGAHTLLKPGGHALVWALPRTAHWTMTALEEAGFEVRDVVSHMFGTGFPKSLDVSKAIDAHIQKHDPPVDWCEPQRWEGWGTALKPAAEFWILARKPLSGTVAANVLEHRTGALNIDGCRIGLAEGEKPYSYPNGPGGNTFSVGAEVDGTRSAPAHGNSAGRWPANVVFSHDPDCVPLGEVRVKAAVNAGSVSKPGANTYGDFAGDRPAFDYADADGCEAVERFACVPGCAVRGLDDQAKTKGASRFFYTAKVSRAERDHGCEHLEHKSGAAMTDRKEGSAGLNSPRAGAGAKNGARNHHPTVKPQALMRWMVRLITPPGGTVLDLFAGSGSTAVAALAEGCSFIGVELSDEYAEIAAARITQALKDYPPTTEDEAAA